MAFLVVGGVCFLGFWFRFDLFDVKLMLFGRWFFGVC